MTKDEFIQWFREHYGPDWHYGMSIHQAALIKAVKQAQNEGYEINPKDVLAWWKLKSVTGEE